MVDADLGATLKVAVGFADDGGPRRRRRSGNTVFGLRRRLHADQSILGDNAGLNVFRRRRTSSSPPAPGNQVVLE